VLLLSLLKLKSGKIHVRIGWGDPLGYDCLQSQYIIVLSYFIVAFVVLHLYLQLFVSLYLISM
jgi:hypothetical protein